MHKQRSTSRPLDVLTTSRARRRVTDVVPFLLIAALVVVVAIAVGLTR